MPATSHLPHRVVPDAATPGANRSSKTYQCGDLDYTIEVTCTRLAPCHTFIARLLTGPDRWLRPVIDRYPVTFSGTSEAAAVGATLEWLRRRHGVEPFEMGRLRVPFDPQAIRALVGSRGGWHYAECPWCGTREAAANHPDDDPPRTVWTCPECNQFSLTDAARGRLEEWRGQDRDAWVRVRQRLRRLLTVAAIDDAITIEHLTDVSNAARRVA